MIMEEKDKDLLLRDLSARLPYKVICRKEYNKIKPLGAPSIEISSLTFLDYNNLNHNGFKSFKPYLRSMSSMTEEERKEYERFSHCSIGFAPILMDWIYSHHLDCCGLIEKGLAIEVTEENNPYKI